jgi:hypothetical protein
MMASIRIIELCLLGSNNLRNFDAAFDRRQAAAMAQNRILLLRAATGPSLGLTFISSFEALHLARNTAFGAPKIAMRPSISNIRILKGS